MRVLLTSLSWTIGIEYLMFALINRRLRFSDFGLLTLINVLTNPLVLYLHRTIFNNWSWFSGFMILEIAVVIVEAVLIAELFSFSLRKALGVSLSCNLASAALGFLILG